MRNVVSLRNDVVSLVDTIILNGIRKNASDIHLQYDEMGENIKYRVDGILYDLSALLFFEKLNDFSDGNTREINVKECKDKDKNKDKIHVFYKNIVEIISRIKILSDMNVAEKRKPQDGSFSFLFNKKKYDIRVALLPLVKGECAVLRLLGSNVENKLETLGFSNCSEKLINKMIKSEYGLILISGATGSGKSTTLMSLINELNNGYRKIITVEDPIELKVKGITQVQVNEEIGVTFYSILKNTLRCDPDIIVISEIRDEITAEIAVRAALTGHLVISTIHTKDAISTVVRLIDMGIPKYLIVDCLIGVISQKLVSKIEGGRSIVSETLYVNDYVKKCLKNSDDSVEIKNLLKEKNSSIHSKIYITFEEDIEEKVDKGIVSKKELYRFDN